jgi:hypothetical protein
MKVPTPSHDQPGTLGQQFAAVAGYLSDPLRLVAPSFAWARARASSIPHAVAPPVVAPEGWEVAI